MMRCFLAAIVLASMPAAACSEPRGSDYFAFSMGRTCNYTVEYLMPNGGVLRGKALTRSDGEETISGKDYLKIVAVFSGLPGLDPQVAYYRNAKDGIWKIEGRHKDKPEHLVAPLPLGVGASWRMDAPEGSCDCRVESKEVVELMSGTYEDSIKLVCTCQTGPSRTELVMYQAAGVGTVRSVAKGPGVTMELQIEQCK